MLKNFQLHFAPKAFSGTHPPFAVLTSQRCSRPPAPAETDAWHAVIHLNIVGHVNCILDALQLPRPGSPPGASSSSAAASASNDLRCLTMRLAPLRRVEELLTRRLAGSLVRLPPSRGAGRAAEVCIRSGSGWKGLLRQRAQSVGTAPDELADAARVIAACREDIIALWADPGVRASLRREGLALEDEPGLCVCRFLII